MSKTPMNPEAAARIQSHADRAGQNQDFKSRAQSSATRNQDASGEGHPGRESIPDREVNRKQR